MSRINPAYIISDLERIESYQENIDMFIRDFANVTDDKIRNEIDKIISENERDKAYHANCVNEALGTNFVFDKDIIDSMLAHLKNIIKEEKTLSNMCEAWDSEDPCEMACNDPGLQFEQGEIVENLWAEFKQTFNVEVN